MHEIAILVVVGLTTAATRFAPFLLFGRNRKLSNRLQALGKALPYALMGMLVVYCLKDVNVANYPSGVPELVGCAVTAGLHAWRRNYLLSIAAGTVTYMLMVQFLFA